MIRIYAMTVVNRLEVRKFRASRRAIRLVGNKLTALTPRQARRISRRI